MIAADADLILRASDGINETGPRIGGVCNVRNENHSCREDSENRYHIWQRTGHGDKLHHMEISGLGHNPRTNELGICDLFPAEVLRKKCGQHK